MSFEILECLFSPLGFLFMSLNLASQSIAVILGLDEACLELGGMFAEFGVRCLVICNFLTQGRDDFRVLALLVAVGLELQFEVSDIALYPSALAGTRTYQLTSLAVFLSVNLASRPRSSTT
jgi:hypothetical protein